MLISCETQVQNINLEFITTPLSTDGETKSFPYTIIWDDSELKTAPSDFSPTLARTALVLSSTAYDYNYALDNLEAMHFKHLAKFNYGDNYNRDAVGVVIASREIGDTTLVCVVLRGTYAKEWYSNFDIGKDINKTKVHSGFSKASEFAFEKLEMYIANYGIDRDHSKFLVTGHSRGAAVANLLSKSLIDTYGADNVYAYTFATPNTTTSDDAMDSRYSGIFNFVNPEDFIAFVPLENWGFTKYGTTIVFPSESTDENYSHKLNEVAQYYKKYRGREFKSYNGTNAQQKFFDKAFELAPTIKDYYDTKYEIAGLQLSLYDYMNVVCAILNEDNLISNGLILLGSDQTQFEQLKDYILIGMDMENEMFSLDYDSSLISYAHPAETYLSWLEVYIAHL